MTASQEKISAQMNPTERELTITRVFDAPRELVFKAWTEPERLKRWWGPHHFTNPTCEVDLRLGGKWHIVMRAPDGGEYPCGGVYQEIVEPELLVFTNIATDPEGKPILDGLTRVTLEYQGGKTKLTLYTRATALVDYAAQMLAGMEAGWTQSIERLQQLVESDTADREIVTTRVFNAPRELVFRAWTEAQHIAQWWGPNGFTSTIHEMDVRPGGAWRLTMHGPDGRDYKNESTFLEVVQPERLAYSHYSPPKFVSTVTFDAQGSKTMITMRMVFETAEEMNTVVKVFGAVEGAKQTFARLAEFLEKSGLV